MPTDDDARLAEIDTEARELGWRISIDEARDTAPGLTHVAWAHPNISQPSMGHFLTYGPTYLAAAEAGLEILRRVIQDGEPWPASS
jgi:hypothetical protein